MDDMIANKDLEIKITYEIPYSAGFSDGTDIFYSLEEAQNSENKGYGDIHKTISYQIKGNENERKM